MTAAREILWRYGHLDALFEELGHDGKLDVQYGKVLQMPRSDGKQGVSSEIVNAFSRTILNLAPPGVIDDILFGELTDNNTDESNELISDDMAIYGVET